MCDSRPVDNVDDTTAPGGRGTGPEVTREPIDKALLFRLILGVAVVVIFVVFALQNTAKVTIQFLSWSFQISQFLTMLLSAIAGVLIWELASAYSRHRKRKQA